MTEPVTSDEFDAMLKKPDHELLLPRSVIEQMRDQVRASEESIARWAALADEPVDTETVTFRIVR